MFGGFPTTEKYDLKNHKVGWKYIEMIDEKLK